VSAAAAVAVTIGGMLFSPAQVTVDPGDSVTWSNVDFAAHDVTSPSFASGSLGHFAGFTQRFDTPGTYMYACSLHPFMTGTVTVNEPSSEPLEFTVRLRGRRVTTDPAQPGKVAYLQRYAKKRWRKVAHVTLDAGGRGTFKRVSGRTRARVGSTYSR
jgi:hypothetical protein